METRAPDPFHRVDRGLTGRGSSARRSSSSSQSPTVTASYGHFVLGLHVLLDEPDPAASVHVLAVPASRGPGRSEQPGAQLALLRPGQLDHLLRCLGAALEWGERLQDRVVHPGRHVGPFLGPDPGLPLDHEVAGDRTHHGPKQDRIAAPPGSGRRSRRSAPAT